MRDLRFYLFLATGLLVVYLVAQYNRPQATDWTPTLKSNDKIPYGTYVLCNQLNDIFPNAKINSYRKPLYNVITESSIKKAAYIIVANSVNLNEYDYKKLIEFLKSGNEVFISAYDFGSEFREKLKTEIDSDKNIDGLKFVNKTLDSAKYYKPEKDIGSYYFSKLDTANAIVLGKDNLNNVNFVKYAFGKGTIYLHADPLLFSNFSVLNDDGATYAATALSFVKNNNNVIWDNYYTAGREGEDNTMRVFLKHPALQWAFYLTFFSFGIFVFYELKRRQRIIPVVEPLKNASLEFATVVGRVYYEKRDNANIAHKKISYLLNYLREQYRLKTSELDGEFIEAFSNKTGIGLSFAGDIVNCVNKLNAQTRITDNELIQLNQLIEKFYTQS